VAEGKSEDDAATLAPSFAPPLLEGEGSKVQPDWLFGFFKAPSPIRPWLAVRMPTFGFADEEANALVNSFASKDQTNFPFRTLPQEAPHGPEMQAAVKMFGPDYFNCWNLPPAGRAEAVRSARGLGARPQPGPPASQSGLDRPLDRESAEADAGHQDPTFLRSGRSKGSASARRPGRRPEAPDRGPPGLCLRPRSAAYRPDGRAALIGAFAAPTFGLIMIRP